MATKSQGQTCRVNEIEQLKELSGTLELQLQKEQECTRELADRQCKLEHEVVELRAAETEATKTKTKHAWTMCQEHARLDADAAAITATQNELDGYRSEAISLMTRVQQVQEKIAGRIDEALIEYNKALQKSLTEISSEWQTEHEALGERLLAADVGAARLREEITEAKQRVGNLRKRTALFRFARASCTWRHLCAVKRIKETARRTKATGLRKLGREMGELEAETTQKREAINLEIRKTEVADDKAHEQRKAEIKSLQNELLSLRERISSVEERQRHRDKISEVVQSVPTSETDRVLRWAEAMSGHGSTDFSGASRRLQARSLIPGLGGVDDDSAIHERRSRRSVPAQSLQRLEGGLLQLEEQISGVLLPPLSRSTSVPQFNTSEVKVRFHASGQSF